MELTNDQYVTIGRIAEESIKQQEKICGYAHMRKSGNGYANIGKFIFDRVYPMQFSDLKERVNRDIDSESDEKVFVPQGMLYEAETTALSLWPVHPGKSLLPKILESALLWMDGEIEKLELCSVDYKNIHRLLHGGMYFNGTDEENHNAIKKQVTCPICVSGDTHRSNTNEHINEPKLPEGLDQLINEFARHRPNDLPIGKSFIFEAFNRGLNVKKETPKDIEDLLWNDDEYESKDKQVNERLIEAYRRGKDSK